VSAQAVPAPASAPHAGPDDAARAALEQLHPLLQPPPPPWTPQTPGWAVLALALALLLAWAAWRGLRRWHARRHRRLARAELRQLRSELAAPADALRRLALAHAARDEVASLQGAAWSAWLDRSLPEDAQPFTRGPGRRLADWAYLPEAALPWDELDPLLDLVERWIGRHRVPLAPQ
jgi:hypothetical protein